MNEFVSVIMSTYNETEMELRAAIDSILNQSYEKVEFIIVSDNPDNEIIKSVLGEYSKVDKRIKLVFNEKNMGLAVSLNRGIEQATGKYIARMDADDISFKDRIEKEIIYLEDNKYDMVTTNRILIDENGTQLTKKTILPSSEMINKILPITNIIIHPSILIKTDVLRHLNGYRNFRASQDYDLWLRMISQGYKIGVLDEPLIYYRIRMNGISKKNAYKQYLISKYEKKLYHERIKKGRDSFSEESLEKYLLKNKCNDERTKIIFNKASSKLGKSLKQLKNKHFLSGSFNLIVSLMMHKEMILRFKEIMEYKRAVKY